MEGIGVRFGWASLIPRAHGAIGVVEEVDSAFRKKSRRAHFSDTVHLLVADVQALVEPGEAALMESAMSEEFWHDEDGR